MTESSGAHVDMDPAWTADTVAVQAGRPARVAGAPMNAPITLSSTYVHDARVEYGRDGNAGWEALEAALGVLDGGSAVTFASGLAATTAIAGLVPPGGTVVLPSVAYYGVRNIFERMQAEGRIHIRMVAADDTDAVLAAADGAAMVWVESIANPLIVVADVPVITAGARERGAITVVDATFATPLRQRPIELGADLVLHSATKLIARALGSPARRRGVPRRRPRRPADDVPPRPRVHPGLVRCVPGVARAAHARRPPRSLGGIRG